MGAPVFHVPELPEGASRVRLDGPEGRHAALVQRLKPGERVDLTDGSGLRAYCVVAVAEREALSLDVESMERIPEPAPRLIAVQALAKGDRGELAVETMTEVGVDVIVPWDAEHSVVRWKGERGEKALARWRSTAFAAAKQSRRAWWPVVEDLASTGDVADLLRAADLGVVLHEAASSRLASVAVPSSGDVVIVVGPEGGISPAELEIFATSGAGAYRLGSTVLRTSTAGPVAAAVLASRTPLW